MLLMNPRPSLRWLRKSCLSCKFIYEYGCMYKLIGECWAAAAYMYTFKHPSLLPQTSCRPLGLYAIADLVRPVCPASALQVVAVPSAQRRHSCTLPSMALLASCLPLGLNATVQTMAA